MGTIHETRITHIGRAVEIMYEDDSHEYISKCFFPKGKCCIMRIGEFYSERMSETVFYKRDDMVEDLQMGSGEEILDFTNSGIEDESIIKY